MAQLICRLPFDGALPEAADARQAGVAAWLLPCRWNTDEGLKLAAGIERVEDLPKDQTFSLEWWLDQALTPGEEERAALALRAWIGQPGALRIGGRPLLWIYTPEHLSHPRFGRKRLLRAIQADLLLLGRGPKPLNDWEGWYEGAEHLTCQRLQDGRLNYESFLYCAHHRKPSVAPLEVPCVRGDREGAMAHSESTLYNEWLTQASGWSDLRHADDAAGWVIVEDWQEHLSWFSQPEPRSSGRLDPAICKPAEERIWGAMESWQPALLVHGFHLGLLEAMLEPLSPIRNRAMAVGLYVSTPHDQLDAVENLLRAQGWRTVCLVGVENRGRDMAPFLLELLPRALAAGHPWLVKLHTKRSENKPGGDRWGRKLLQDLASAESLTQIAERFGANPDLSLITPQGSLLPTSVHLGGNQSLIKDLLQLSGFDPVEWLNQTFVAGSMWAARSSSLAPLLKLRLAINQFDVEAGQTDGTLAHACERMIPTWLRIQQQSIEEIGETRPERVPFGYQWAAPGDP